MLSMRNSTVKEELNPAFEEGRNILDELLREGARKMLQYAIEKEVSDYISQFEELRDSSGSSYVFRNGYAPEREILSGIGPIKVKRPRVDDRKVRKLQDFERFSSQILPRFLIWVPSINNLLPVLYFEGDLYWRLSCSPTSNFGR